MHSPIGDEELQSGADRETLLLNALRRLALIESMAMTISCAGGAIVVFNALIDAMGAASYVFMSLSMGDLSTLVALSGGIFGYFITRQRSSIT